MIPLRRLFDLKDYPRDVMVLYAEGYSVTNFLVSQSSRSVFLAFVAQGMQGNWDRALQTHYRYRSVEDLEAAWVQHVYSNRPQPIEVASTRGRGEVSPTSRVVVRQTAPPVQPLLEAPQPIYRGQAPGEDEGVDPRREYRRTPPAQPVSRPPQGYRVPPPPTVSLGAPEFEQAPPAMPQFGPRSPVGYSP